MSGRVFQEFGDCSFALVGGDILLECLFAFFTITTSW